MTPDVVVDIGNTAHEVGPVSRRRAWPDGRRFRSDDPAAWDRQARRRGACTREPRWAVAERQPAAVDRFVDWATDRGGDAVLVSASTRDVRVERGGRAPEQVGIDRLLNAVAGRAAPCAAGPPVVISRRRHRGDRRSDRRGRGVPGRRDLPGPRLMARSLHDYTAKLPLVEPTTSPAESIAPGKNTDDAIQAGIAGGDRWGGRRPVSRVRGRLLRCRRGFCHRRRAGDLGQRHFARRFERILVRPHAHPRRHPHRGGGAAVSDTACHCSRRPAPGPSPRSRSRGRERGNSHANSSAPPASRCRKRPN